METWKNFLIKTDAKTINNTYNFHQIDLDTMLHEGECEEDDEICMDCTDGELKVFFTNGGVLANISDPKMVKAIFKNSEKF